MVIYGCDPKTASQQFFNLARGSCLHCWTEIFDYTTVTADGIEECRKLCGGHGHLCSSGHPELFVVYIPACMYEGDNVVLLLQVARHLMKSVRELGSAEDWLRDGTVLEAFEARAARMSVACAKILSTYESPEEGSLRIATRYSWKGCKRTVRGAMLYLRSLLHKYQGDFLSTGSIAPTQASLANNQLRYLYSQVRPNALALVDSFNYIDHYLGSILGSYDGNVYPKLYKAAWKDPLNDSVVPDGYYQYVRPLLKKQFLTTKL